MRDVCVIIESFGIVFTPLTLNYVTVDFLHFFLLVFNVFSCCSDKKSTMAEIVEQVQEREAAHVRETEGI